MINDEELAEATAIAALEGVGCWRQGAKHLSFQLHATQARLEEAAGMFGFYVTVDHLPRFGARAPREVTTIAVGYFGTLAEATKKAVEAILAHEAARKLDVDGFRRSMEFDE